MQIIITYSLQYVIHSMSDCFLVSLYGSAVKLLFVVHFHI